MSFFGGLFGRFLRRDTADPAADILEEDNLPFDELILQPEGDLDPAVDPNNNLINNTNNNLLGRLFGGPVEDEIDMTHENPDAVMIIDILKAYPVPLKNNNKVILPESILAELHKKKVWDRATSRDRPLIFELTLADPDSGDIIEETYAGVDNFTAPPGTVGLPYKTALSLTKQRGISFLNQVNKIGVRFVEISSEKQTSIKVQPRGKGFFLEDESMVQLDIKTVLEMTLRDHLVLYKGDWIPLFWDNNRFELVVKDVEPNEIIDVLNTDLTVEMLPSEETEQSIKEKEEAQQKVKNFVLKREKKYAVQMENIAKKDNAEPDKADKDAITVRVKLPKGGAVTRRLSRNNPFGLICDVIDVELFNRKFTPMHLPPENMEYFFNILYTLPGKEKTIIETDKCAGLTVGEVLDKYEIKQKQVSLMLEMIKDSFKEDETNGAKSTKKKGFQSLNNEWAIMADRLENSLQQNNDEPEVLPQNEVSDISGKLEAVGCDPELSQRVARLYGKQVNELISMGYESQMSRAIEILNEKKGDIQQVVEKLLTEGDN